MKLRSLIGTLLALGCLGLALLQFSKLLDIGTCGSDGTYVAVRPCPEGTGGHIMLLIGAIFAYVIMMFISGQMVFLWGMLFVALGAGFIKGGMDSDDFAITGYVVGGVFLLMGGPAVLFAVRGWFDGGADEQRAVSTASGLASYTTMAQNMMAQAATMAPPVATITPTAPVATATKADPIARLEELAKLKESGVLTEAEFQAQKQKILSSS